MHNTTSQVGKGTKHSARLLQIKSKATTQVDLTSKGASSHGPQMVKPQPPWRTPLCHRQLHQQVTSLCHYWSTSARFIRKGISRWQVIMIGGGQMIQRSCRNNEGIGLVLLLEEKGRGLSYHNGVDNRVEGLCSLSGGALSFAPFPTCRSAARRSPNRSRFCIGPHCPNIRRCTESVFNN